MFKNEYTLSVDIKKSMSAVIPTFVQYDSATLIFKIFDDGKPFDLTDFTSADVTHVRPDGVIVVGSGLLETIANDEEIIRYTYLGSEMSVPGFVTTSLTLYSNNNTRRVSIMPFRVEIIGDSYEGSIGVTPEIGLLQQLIISVSDANTQANEAVQNANQATQDANQAITNATTAATNANTARDNANDAATSANEAKDNVNEAIINANIAKDNATAATTAATQATTNANTAATNANAATTAATAATANATTALTATTTATTNANTATTNANAARDSAITAATNANTAKDNAIIATTNANTAINSATQATTAANTATSNATTATTAANTATTNANAATNAANTATSAANSATTNTNVAINNAQAIADNTRSVGVFDFSTAYLKNNIVTSNGSSWIALSNTQNNPLPTYPAIQNTWWRLLAIKGTDGMGAVSTVNGVSPDLSGNVTVPSANVINSLASSSTTEALSAGKGKELNEKMETMNVFIQKDEFISTANQTVFTLTGTYNPHQNRIEVEVGGVKQYSPTNFTETSTNSFTLVQPIPAGLIVVATYYSNLSPITVDVDYELSEMESRIVNWGTQLSTLDEALNEIASVKAPLTSPDLTGIPTAPTATFETNTTQIATTAFVQTNVNNHLNDNATTTEKGHVQLTSAVDSESEALGATAKSVKTVNDSLTTHANDKANPHAVTKAQIGLTNVDNIQQATKTEFSTHTSQNATTTTKGHVQLTSAVDNDSEALGATAKAVKTVNDRITNLKATEREAVLMNDDNVYMTPFKTKNAIARASQYQLGIIHSQNRTVLLGEKYSNKISFRTTMEISEGAAIKAAISDATFVVFYPLLKANGTPVTKLPIGLHDVYVSDTSFTLKDKGGEYGTVRPQDVRVGKTFGTENGVVNGTFVGYGVGEYVDDSKIVAPIITPNGSDANYKPVWRGNVLYTKTVGKSSYSAYDLKGNFLYEFTPASLNGGYSTANAIFPVPQNGYFYFSTTNSYNGEIRYAYAPSQGNISSTPVFFQSGTQNSFGGYFGVAAVAQDGGIYYYDNTAYYKRTASLGSSTVRWTRFGNAPINGFYPGLFIITSVAGLAGTIETIRDSDGVTASQYRWRSDGASSNVPRGYCFDYVNSTLYMLPGSQGGTDDYYKIKKYVINPSTGAITFTASYDLQAFYTSVSTAQAFYQSVLVGVFGDKVAIKVASGSTSNYVGVYLIDINLSTTPVRNSLLSSNMDRMAEISATDSTGELVIKPTQIFGTGLKYKIIG